MCKYAHSGYDMNWDDFRYFLALCREGSVSRAGQTLGVTHTTVARRIQALEAALKTRLFDRTPEGYVMTQAAETMFEDVERIENRVHAIDREIVGRDLDLSGPLTITTPYDFAIAALLPGFRKFRRQYPRIKLTLSTTTSFVDLSAREADIAVRLTARPPENLVGRRVLPLRHGIYTTRAYLRAAGNDPELILFSRGDERPDWATKHFPNADVALRTDNVATMRAAVLAGLGVARIPCFIGDADKRLCRLDLEMQPSDWGIWTLSHVDLRSTARVRVARDFLADTILEKRALILGEASRYA
jgi:DNA-binding transcriptional LysR family regulator